MKYVRALLPAALLTILLLLLAGAASGEVAYGGKQWDPDAIYIDLGEQTVQDFDAFEAFLDQMPALRQVDMFATVVNAGTCDRLAARYPQIEKWGWTMRLQGKDHFHLIRTDFTSWSTLHNNKSSHHKSEDFRILKYCWNLKALDIGHNSVTDLDFLYDLPDLRVLIVACNMITDITPVAALKNLEYVELFKNKITDISPLRDLDHLLDVNICFNRISDWSPLYNLPNLMRLWLYSSQKINAKPPADVVQTLRELYPRAEIDSSHYSTMGTWRWLNEDKGIMSPHYAVITQMFGANHIDPKFEYIPFEESYRFFDNP